MVLVGVVDGISSNRIDFWEELRLGDGLAGGDGVDIKFGMVVKRDFEKK